jgi:hypothetical protein
MAKYLLLKHYRGAPAPVNDVSMDQWRPDEVEVHPFMNDFAARLESSGEFIDGQALSPDGVGPLRRRGAAAGDRRPVRRDEGPDRGWMVIDVDSYERAIELAGELSAAPGPAANRSANGWRSDPSWPRRHRHPVTVDDVELRARPTGLSVLVRRGRTSRRPRTPCKRRSSGRSPRGTRCPPTHGVAHHGRGELPRHGAVGRRAAIERSDSTPNRRPVRSERRRHAAPLLPVAHPDLTSSSAVALTLRAVGGLTTRQIAQAYLVPSAPWRSASAAKRTVSRAGVDRPGDVRT